MIVSISSATVVTILTTKSYANSSQLNIFNKYASQLLHDQAHQVADHTIRIKSWISYLTSGHWPLISVHFSIRKSQGVLHLPT